ncbi:MAG: hypothetical protein Q8P60_04575 [Pseudorhodobacter sp.]|nr:hypothetical protein [Pseudorhodobacter sp.]
MFILPMDAASEWLVRQIRRHWAKLPLIISVVKIKMMVEVGFADVLVQFTLLCSNYQADGTEKALFFVWRSKK